ncbi:MAG: flippase-like domain-containing protein [Nitrososphaerota archaeon]|jgi:uncharacterized protein (TIRG00374 family)|nr:flippase-like domain-containing protein [Nitrososphaerota archaeon]
MEPSKPKFTYKTVLFPLLGLAGFFIYIYFFQVDLGSIIITLQTVNPLLFGLAVGCGLLEIFFFTFSWRVLACSLDIKMTLKRAWLYVWYGIYVDILVPAESVSGEVVRVYLLARDRCGSSGKVFASLFAHRLLGMALNVVVLVLGIVLLSFEGLGSSFVFNFIICVAVGILAVIVVLMVFALKKSWSLKVIDWGVGFVAKVSRGRWKLGFREQTLEMVSHFHESMSQYSRSMRVIGESLFHLAVSWFFSLSVPYLVFYSLGHPVSWSVVLVTSAIVLAVKSIPVGVPFEVGIPEAVMTTLFFALGIDAALSATATILTRLITLWFRFFIGFVAQQYLEFKPALPERSSEKTKNVL